MALPTESDLAPGRWRGGTAFVSACFCLRGLKPTPHVPYSSSCPLCDLPCLVSLLLWVLTSAPTLPSGHSTDLGPPTPTTSRNILREATLGTEAARDLIPCSVELPRVGPPPPRAPSSLASRPHRTFPHSCTTGSPYDAHFPKIPPLALPFSPLLMGDSDVRICDLLATRP